MRPAFIGWIFLCAVAAWGGELRVSQGTSTSFNSIQSALNAADPGDMVLVETGIYREQIVFPRSGEPGAPILLRNAEGHAPIIDGGNFSRGYMILIEDVDHVGVSGFEIRNLTGIRDGSGIRVRGGGTNITIQDCEIHHILGIHAMGLTVYGTSDEGIRNLVIQRVTIHDCEPARSEALAINGNVDGFLIEDCVIYDVNNIGIDMIGGEGSVHPYLAARNGICRGNTVVRARSSYGGGWAAGIYVDGGHHILVEDNVVYECNLGIEVGAENAGVTAYDVVVRNNRIYRNDKVGLIFGGYDGTVGRTRYCYFLNNTTYGNDTENIGLGEIYIQFAENNVVANNIFYGRQGNSLMTSSPGGNVNNLVNYNLWYSPSAFAKWTWMNQTYQSLAAFQAGTDQEPNGLFADPLFRNPETGDFSLLPNSPAIDAGSHTPVAGQSSQDMDGQPRVLFGRVDMGADEFNGEDCVATAMLAWLSGQGFDCTGDGVKDFRDLMALRQGRCDCP